MSVNSAVLQRQAPATWKEYTGKWGLSWISTWGDVLHNSHNKIHDKKDITM